MKIQLPILTRAHRDRVYQLQVRALAMENAVAPLERHELRRRLREIYAACYGKEP
jgi:hypothetical protein